MKKNEKKYSGLTLVEMVVTIGILSISMTGMSIFFIKSWKANSYIYETGQDSLVASRIVDAIVNDLRKIRQADNGDYPIYSASDFDLIVYADIDGDNDVERIHYFLDQDANELRLGVSEPSTSNPPDYSSEDDSVTVLAAYVMNDESMPLFAYFGNDYLSNPTPFSVPVDSSEIIDIRIVKVNIWVDLKPHTSPDYINIESFAQLRNL